MPYLSRLLNSISASGVCAFAIRYSETPAALLRSIAATFRRPLLESSAHPGACGIRVYSSPGQCGYKTPLARANPSIGTEFPVLQNPPLSAAGRRVLFVGRRGLRRAIGRQRFQSPAPTRSPPTSSLLQSTASNPLLPGGPTPADALVPSFSYFETSLGDVPSTSSSKQIGSQVSCLHCSVVERQRHSVHLWPAVSSIGQSRWSTLFGKAGD